MYWRRDSLTPEQSLPVDSGGYAPQIIAGPRAVWVLTPSGLARTDPATGKITAIIHTSYASSTMSAPALIMDSAGRLWITGSLLTVVMPDTLTAYPVAHTPDLISAATDGPAIWINTRSTLARSTLASLQAGTPRATSAAADQRPPRSNSLTAHQVKSHDHDAAPARQPEVPRKLVPQIALSPAVASAALGTVS